MNFGETPLMVEKNCISQVQSLVKYFSNLLSPPVFTNISLVLFLVISLLD